MPAYGTLDVSGSAFYTASKPAVRTLSEYGAGAFIYCEVLNITTRTGILPDEAVIVIQAKDGEGPFQTTPITMPNGGELDYDHLRFYSRIAIDYAGETVFVGSLVNRKESGKDNTITLTYWDDRHLLAKMPLRGCLVADPLDLSVKLIPGYVPWVNPNGYRNAQAVNISSVPGLENIRGKFYVFSAFAEMGAEGDDEDSTEEGSTEEIDTVIWTPARWLNYLLLYSQWRQIQDIGGTDTDLFPEHQNFHADRLRINEFALVDGDSQQKMTSQNFMGQTVLGAMIKGLEATGAYGLKVTPSYDLIEIGTYRKFALSTGSAEEEEEWGLDIRMKRSGAIAGADTAFDFTYEADARKLVTNVLVEGARYKLESEFQFDGSPSSATFLPEWTPQEGILYHIAIQGGGTDKYSGGSVSGDGIHAVGPVNPEGLHSVNSWVVMDGTDGRPEVLRRTESAVSYARQLFPKAWRAFRIATGETDGGDDVRDNKLGKIPGVPGAPFLNIARQPLPEQLQSYFEEVNELRGRVRYPIRVQVSDSPEGEAFHDVTHAAGLWSTPDGTIYFDGLTDVVGPAADRIYEGDFRIEVTDWTTPTTDLYETANGIALRKIKINMAVPHDLRVNAFGDFLHGSETDYHSISDYIDESISNLENRTALTHYVLSPEDYREEWQVDSHPYAGLSRGEGGTANILYSTDAIYSAVSRLLKEKGKLDLKTTWNLVGIRPEYRAGAWLNKAVFEGQGYSKKIRQPAEETVFDFHAHETRVSSGE